MTMTRMIMTWIMKILLMTKRTIMMKMKLEESLMMRTRKRKKMLLRDENRLVIEIGVHLQRNRHHAEVVDTMTSILGHEGSRMVEAHLEGVVVVLPGEEEVKWLLLLHEDHGLLRLAEVLTLLESPCRIPPL